MEASQSTLQARLTELETKSSAVVPSEVTEPAVAEEVTPPMEVTSKAAEEPVVGLSNDRVICVLRFLDVGKILDLVNKYTQ